jgi:hypothetical protein
MIMNLTRKTSSAQLAKMMGRRAYYMRKELIMMKNKKA